MATNILLCEKKWMLESMKTGILDRSVELRMFGNCYRKEEQNGMSTLTN